MPVPDALLIVEGPHDAALVGRLLRAVGYRRVTAADRVPEDWQKLINRRFPQPGRGLDQVHEVPHFWWQGNEGALVTTVIAGGDSKLVSALDGALTVLERVPAAIGIVLDDDQEPDPRRRHQRLMDSVTENAARAGRPPLTFPPVPGSVEVNASGRFGVFVLPDNQGGGTLETVLLEAGGANYAPLLHQADAFVANLETGVLTAKDLEEGNKAAGHRKQIVAAAVAILKPGKTVAVSLQDNRWLEGAALQTPLVADFRGWLHDLLELTLSDRVAPGYSALRQGVDYSRPVDTPTRKSVPSVT